MVGNAPPDLPVPRDRDRYLVKPFDLEDLLTIVRELIHPGVVHVDGSGAGNVSGHVEKYVGYFRRKLRDGRWDCAVRAMPAARRGILLNGPTVNPGVQGSVMSFANDTIVKEVSMPKQIIYTDKAPMPPPTYSQAVKVNGLVFVAAQGPYDPLTNEVVGETIQEQTRQCLRNVVAILEAAGSSLEQIASTTFILREESDFAGLNEEWVRWFPVDPPARQGAKLPIVPPGGMKLTVAAIAEA